MFQEMLWDQKIIIPGFVYVICHVAIIIFISAISVFSQNCRVIFLKSISGMQTAFVIFKKLSIIKNLTKLYCVI